MENGKDTRDLGKLQEMLFSNPGAVEAIDSMLKLIKSGNTTGANAVCPPTEGPPEASSARPQRGPVQGNSETTVYTRAVPSASPSQEANAGVGVPMERLNRSLDAVTIDPGFERPRLTNSEILIQSGNNAEPQINGPPSFTTPSFPEDQPQPQGSNRDPDRSNQIHQDRLAAKARTDAMVVEAERQKLSLEKPLTGNDLATVSLNEILDKPGSTNLECDDKLFAPSAHLDKLTIVKIERGEYVELSRLLPRDKVVPEDEFDKVEIVSKDGKPAFNPVGDKDSAIINSYKCWEAAFDIYAGIYVKAHPRRGPEIFQYKHTIRMASESFVWSGIYAYDKVFRMHM